MGEFTELDRAHARMQADENDAAARLDFFERLADTEFFLLLAEEPSGEAVKPHIFPVEGQQFVLVFDREDRLTSFVSAIASYVALSGRAIANMLAGKGIGLGVNLDVAPSSILIPDEALGWLLVTLSTDTEVECEVPVELKAPAGVSERLLNALSTKLALASGLAGTAYLARARYKNGQSELLLGFVDALPESETALSQALSEALIFSGVEKGTLDVAFFRSTDALCTVLERVGMRFDIPEVAETLNQPTPPGMNPDQPPKLD